MSEPSSEASQTAEASQKNAKSDKFSVIRAWALVLLAVLAGGSVFLRGRRLVDNIIPVSADEEAPAEVQRDK